MKRFTQLAVLFVCGFGTGWLAKPSHAAESDCVPRQAYREMATQSNRNLDSFLDAQRRVVELEGENAKLRDELSHRHGTHK
jgi:hypothetical protein